MKKQEVFIFMENKMKLLLVEDDVNTCEIFKKIERAKRVMFSVYMLGMTIKTAM